MLAAKKTIKKAVCNGCGTVESKWYGGRKHASFYGAKSCLGTFVETDVAKEVITGEFTFDRSYGNTVYLKHNETGRTVNIYTVDLLKVLAGRGIGSLSLTESKRGSQSCWKAEEAN